MQEIKLTSKKALDFLFKRIAMAFLPTHTSRHPAALVVNKVGKGAQGSSGPGFLGTSTV